MAGYRLLEAAEKEAGEAADRYQVVGGTNLAAGFLDEVIRCALLVAERPGMGTLRRPSLRVLPLRRFPYCLVYAEQGEGVVILSVSHQRRHPRHWVGRLKELP